MLLYLLLFLLLKASSTLCSGIKLESSILSKIDGLKGLIDEHKIHKCLYTAKEIANLQYGPIDKHTKKRYPQYKFRDKFYNLKELVKIEERYIKANNSDRLKELENILVQVKKDFLSL